MPKKRGQGVQWREEPKRVFRSYGGRFQIIKDPASEQDGKKPQYLLQDTMAGIEYVCPSIDYAKAFVNLIIIPYEKNKTEAEVEDCMRAIENSKKKKPRKRAAQKKPRQSHAGFTVTNLVIAMLVFAILVVVGVFCYQRQITITREMDAQSHIQSYATAADAFLQKYKEDCLRGVIGITAINAFLDEDDGVTPQNNAYIPGDANADGYITVYDAGYARYMMNNRSDPEICSEEAILRADANGDGALTSADISLIQKLASGEKDIPIDLAADYLRGYSERKDPWGKSYKFTLIPDEGSVSMELRSAGRDGIYDNEDDIVSLFQPKYDTGAVRF